MQLPIETFPALERVGSHHGFVGRVPEIELSHGKAVVLENLDKQGYHLQMPPAEEEYIEHLPEELLRRNDPV